MYRLTVFALLLPLLAACGSPGQYEVSRALLEGEVQSGSCGGSIETDQQYWPIAAHMPLAGAPATVAQLADPSFPDPGTARLMARWRVALQRCRLATIAAVQIAAPDALPALEVAYSSSDAVLDALAQGTMTWGEANRRRDEIVVQAGQQLDAAVLANRAAIAEAECTAEGP